MSIKHVFVAICILLGPSFALGSLSISKVFTSEDHCVAYHTEKTFFLLRTVDVFGKNCDISSQVIPEPGDKSYVEVAIPILSFESGEVERDRDVAKLLQVDKAKEIIFQSESLIIQDW